jgi:hypothetical protein
MGTSNFHNVNARNVYAVLMNYEQPVLDADGEETDVMEDCAPESWECEDFFSNLKENAAELAPLKGFSYHHTCDTDPHELRSYSSIPMFQFYKNKKFGDTDVTVNINCVVRGAYYEGASLDWYITYDVCGINMDQIDFLADMEWQSSMPAGMVKIQCKNAEQFASTTAEELIEVVEEFYKQNSMPLGVVARFSNGETHYAKI